MKLRQFILILRLIFWPFSWNFFKSSINTEQYVLYWGGGGTTISLQKINVAIDWHDGFQVAVNVELNEVWCKREVWQEYLLGSCPMRVDLLIKKDWETQAVKREEGIYDLTGDSFPCNWLLPMNLQKRKIIVFQSLAAQIYFDERETLGTKDIVIR